MKNNENDNMPCCGEYLSGNSGVWCFWYIVAKGKNIARTSLFKG